MNGANVASRSTRRPRKARRVTRAQRQARHGLAFCLGFSLLGFVTMALAVLAIVELGADPQAGVAFLYLAVLGACVMLTGLCAALSLGDVR